MTTKSAEIVAETTTYQPVETDSKTTTDQPVVIDTETTTDQPVEKTTTDHPVSTLKNSLILGKPLGNLNKVKSEEDAATTVSGKESTEDAIDHAKDLADLVKPEADPSPPTVVKPEMDLEEVDPDAGGGSTSLVFGVVFGLILMSVLLFVGLKRLDAVRRRREYRRMNDFLIDGMYNDI